MRIDKLLWFLRFAKTRGQAQEWVEQGHIRRNGQRIERCSASVALGDVLVLPVPSGVRVIRVTEMPLRRGPPLEAQSCYQVLDDTRPSPLAAGGVYSSSKGDLQP